ncbi:MAG: hypothetical protein ABSF14_09230 [Terriglobia bacterium]
MGWFKALVRSRISLGLEIVALRHQAPEPLSGAGSLEAYGGRPLVAWRVMLPALAFLGHNAAYLMVGFLCLFWLKHEEDEGEAARFQKHSRVGYNLAALFFFFLFLDNLLRRIEGRGWAGFWPCSGRLEVVVLFGTLSLIAQFLYWSRMVRGLNQEQA